MLSRRLLPSVWVVALALECLLTRSARANPANDSSPQASATATAASPKRSGFEVLATGGFGESTGDVRNVEVQPYGASVGLDLGYAFASGFRLGAGVGYGFGRAVRQRHDPLIGNDFDLTFDASSVNVATSVAYDVPLFFLKLRYTLAFGGMFMSWDMGDVPPRSIFSDISATSPASGFFLAPGLAVLWSHEALQCGVGFDYFVQTNDAIPPGMLGKVLVGVKL